MRGGAKPYISAARCSPAHRQLNPRERDLSRVGIGSGWALECVRLDDESLQGGNGEHDQGCVPFKPQRSSAVLQIKIPRHGCLGENRVEIVIG